VSVFRSVSKCVLPSVHRASSVPAALMGGAAPVTYLDESIRTGSVAYSFRNLWSSYSGSCLRVRRSSDNAEQDIGFRSDGWIDAVSLLAFCGAGNGFVKTWYDQGSLANNLTQSTSANQPSIVVSGALQTSASYNLAVKFDGTNDLLVSASTFDASTIDELSMVIGCDTTSAGDDKAVLYSSGSTANAGIGFLTKVGSLPRLGLWLGGGFELYDRPSGGDYGRTIYGFTANNSNATGSKVSIFSDGTFNSTGWTQAFTTANTGNFSNNSISMGATSAGASLAIVPVDFALIAKRILTLSEMQSIASLAKWPGIVLGDSVTAAYLGTNAVSAYVYSDSERVGLPPLLNLAIPGNTIAQQKTAWQACVNRKNAPWVSVQVGLNSMDPAVSAATTIAAYQDLINTIRSDNATCKIIGMALTPAYERWPGAGWDQTTAQAKWVAFNDAIMGRGGSPITGLDAKTESHTTALTTLVSGNAALAAAYDTGDHIHPNNTGRAINGDALHDVLVTLGLI